MILFRHSVTPDVLLRRVASAIAFLIPIIAIIPSSSCREETPPGPNGSNAFDLRVEDTSSTEAWLRISLDSSIQPRTLRLKRDTITILVTTLASPDTLYVDEGLLPNHTYNYTLTRPTGFGGEESRTASVTTMDTTSHNFTFQIDTLGDGNGSVLEDVAIINDTLAYAVGEIYLRDSTGQFDPNAYNMAKWNGQRWALMRIQFYTFCGQSGTGSYPAKAIFAFNAQDIWVTMDGSQVVRWNGQSQSSPMCIPVSVNKLWGENPNSVYAVGYGGGIAHYASGTWRRIESGTTIDILDIWGGGSDILAVASYGAQVPQAMKLLRIEGTTVSEISSNGLPLALASVWFVSDRKYFVGGDLLYRTYALGTTWQREPNQPNYYVFRVRGTGLNDIVVAGGFGHFSHFNGVTWKHYTGNELPRIDGNYYSAAIRSRIIAAVGGIVGGKAMAVVGRQ